MKVTRNQQKQYTITLYIDGVFEKTYTLDANLNPLESQTRTYLMLGSRRVGRYRTGAAMGGGSQVDHYYLQDHLGSSTVTLEYSTNASAWIAVAWEEYYPFGETSYGGELGKRYRYTGKERDEESGLYYYGARYYDAWTCRFVSVDPLADEMPQWGSYCYAYDNPVVYNDPTGMVSETSDGGEDGASSNKPGVFESIADSIGKMASKVAHGGANLRKGFGMLVEKLANVPNKMGEMNGGSYVSDTNASTLSATIENTGSSIGTNKPATAMTVQSSGVLLSKDKFSSQADNKKGCKTACDRMMRNGGFRGSQGGSEGSPLATEYQDNIGKHKLKPTDNIAAAEAEMLDMLFNKRQPFVLGVDKGYVSGNNTKYGDPVTEHFVVVFEGKRDAEGHLSSVSFYDPGSESVDIAVGILKRNPVNGLLEGTSPGGTRPYVGSSLRKPY